MTKRGTRSRLCVAAALWVSSAGLLGLTGSADAIGGLCNGLAASDTTLDASGQYGPAFIVGTAGDDVIIGTDGDDLLEGLGGSDAICGADGDDHIFGGPGSDVIRGDGGDDYIDAGDAADTVVGDVGNDFIRGGLGPDVLLGGFGDDVLIGSDDEEVDILISKGGPVVDPFHEFDVCLFSAGDEFVDCNY